jgi:hypothetical protein
VTVPRMTLGTVTVVKSMKKYLILLSIFVSLLPALFAQEEPADIVDAQIEQVWNIRQTTGNIDEFGPNTMGQAMCILRLKEHAVQPLASHLEWEKDWMIRYWIVDLLGYLPGSQKIMILKKTVGNESEHVRVRLRAVESLAKSEDTQAAVRCLVELKKEVKNKKVKSRISECLSALQRK